jgi:8-oxo-dGTP pyrophosphatase MutT (NUDIX family)
VTSKYRISQVLWISNQYGSRFSFPYYEPCNTEEYTAQVASPWKFFIPDDNRCHGYLLSSVVEKMPWTSRFRVLPGAQEVYLLRGDGEDWQASCSKAIDELLDLARQQGIFPKLGRKRDERFPVLGAKFDLSIERSAFSLFGIIGRGAHMTVFVRNSSGLKFWIPQRNPNKSTYPGMLDNAVAGGVAAGEMPFECIVREASEEAALPEKLVRRDARAAGTVTWFNISDEKAGGQPGLMNPGLLYVYDLEVSEGVMLKPVDNDVYAFHLMDTQQVVNAMIQGEFKPSSAMVMIDFFVRHGIITAENEVEYVEIVSRLHRKLPFPSCPP